MKLKKYFGVLRVAVMLISCMLLAVACNGDETPTEQPTEAPTDAPATEAPTETDAPKGGCKSSVMGVAAVMTAMAAAVALKKKD